MVKQPNESIYVKSFNRIDEMRQVYEMHYLQHLSVPEIISRTGVKRTQVYKFLNIFAAEYPDLVEQMKKKREDVSSDDYTLSLLFTVSLISMLGSPAAYAPIATLYFVVLVIRLTTHFMVGRIKKKTGNEPKATFREEHGALLFGAILFAIYAVLCAFYGRVAFERMANVDYTLFLTFGLFVPWAAVKLVLGSISFIRAKKRGDPSLMLFAYLDILLSIYTLAQTFAIVAVKAHMEGFRVAAIVLAVMLSVYCLICSIRMIVIGIRGLMGKRLKAFSLYDSYHRDD